MYVLVEDMIGREFPENAPMVLYKLRKEYPSPSGGPPYVAVHSISVAIEKNECFGLLGPNGRCVCTCACAEHMSRSIFHQLEHVKLP